MASGTGANLVAFSTLAKRGLVKPFLYCDLIIMLIRITSFIVNHTTTVGHQVGLRIRLLSRYVIAYDRNSQVDQYDATYSQNKAQVLSHGKAFLKDEDARKYHERGVCDHL